MGTNYMDTAIACASCVDAPFSPIIWSMVNDGELDELFQLSPGEFTAARNALAKRAGTDGAAIKALSKPPLAAWAVNQLYWKDRDRYDALVDAANEMRRTHKAVIEGRRGDLRAAGREHDAALDAALKATLALLEAAGQPATDAARHAILNTLRALPSTDAPGRLTQALAPGGFEMLAGITPGAAPKKTSKTPKTAASSSTSPGGRKTADVKAHREASKARERRAEAERAVREADQHARHAEFETARAARDATRADRRLEQARKALDEAQAELEAAEREAERAERARETAERKSRDAQSALATARSGLLRSEQ